MCPEHLQFVGHCWHKLSFTCLALSIVSLFWTRSIDQKYIFSLSCLFQTQKITNSLEICESFANSLEILREFGDLRILMPVLPFSDKRFEEIRIFTNSLEFYANSLEILRELSQISRNLRNISICNECSQVLRQSTCRQKAPRRNDVATIQEESQPFSRNFSKFGFCWLSFVDLWSSSFIHAFGKVQSAEKASL